MPTQNLPAPLRAICDNIQQRDDEIVRIQRILTAFRAVPPQQGGNGEKEKADWIATYLRTYGVSDVRTFSVRDTRVRTGVRPTIIATIPGASRETLWIFTHTDVVSAGDLDAWTQDPWIVTRNGDWLCGRGVEDNQQALVSTLLLAKAITETGVVPERTLGLVFMADEESGSAYGIVPLLRADRERFAPTDLYLVPDFGTEDASSIEIAEKGSYWYRMECIGKQCHASTPEKGNNAFVAASAWVVALAEKLPKAFPEQDSLFSPATSTFVPSMPLTITQGINIVPGKAVFHLDCRLLPSCSPKKLEETLAAIAEEIANRYSVQTKSRRVQAQASSTTDPSTPCIQELQQAVHAVYGITPKCMGLGGGTVAAHLRAYNYPALVWSCSANTCHEPNERSSLRATKNDSCVFAHMLFPTHV